MRALFGGAERPSNPMRKTRHRGGRHYSCMVDRHGPTPLNRGAAGRKARGGGDHERGCRDRLGSRTGVGLLDLRSLCRKWKGASARSMRLLRAAVRWMVAAARFFLNDDRRTRAGWRADARASANASANGRRWVRRVRVRLVPARSRQVRMHEGLPADRRHDSPPRFVRAVKRGFRPSPRRETIGAGAGEPAYGHPLAFPPSDTQHARAHLNFFS